MLVRHPLTSIWKKPDPIVPEPTILSPTSPIERNPMSPKGWKNRDSGGIGLGIVAALGDAPAKIMVGTTNILVSAPVAIASPRIIGCRGGEGQVGCSRASHGSNWADTGFFCGSPDEETTEFSVADFLSHCYLCRKRLHGKDIYMYRGEKAFCSMECRYRQIVNEEFQETCGSEISKAADLSSSAYSGGGRLFFTGIVA